MIRAIIATYGLIAYVSFLAVFVYLIGFMWNFGVPKGINEGEAGSFVLAILVNAVLLALFGLQHSVMARPAFKRWWLKYIPKPAERSTYVLLASAVLGLMMWAWQPIPHIVWDVGDTPAGPLLFAVSAFGWIMVLASTFHIDHFLLFGLKQATFYLLRRRLPAPDFIVRGFYHLVRHPLMLGFLIAFWATPRMTVGHLEFAIFMTGYILVALRYEERDLVDELGTAYIAYQKRTPMLNPLKHPILVGGDDRRDARSAQAVVRVVVETELSGPIARP